MSHGEPVTRVEPSKSMEFHARTFGTPPSPGADGLGALNRMGVDVCRRLSGTLSGPDGFGGEGVYNMIQDLVRLRDAATVARSMVDAERRAEMSGGAANAA